MNVTASPPAPAASLEWTFNPWAESAPRAALALAAACAVAAVVLLMPLAPLTRAVLALVSLVALGPGFAAVRCRIDDAGASRRVAFLWWDRRSWDAIRAARVSSRGCLVSSRAPGSPLAGFGALVLPLPRRSADAAELRQRIEHRLEDHGL